MEKLFPSKMTLYFGSKKSNLSYGNASMYVLGDVIPTGVILQSSDNYILRDINGRYLTAKESE